jgi:hypothetical protein
MTGRPTHRRTVKRRKTRCKCGKRRFRDQIEATRVLHTIQAATKQRRKSPCRVYLCGLCEGWHLTSQKLGEIE